VKGVSSVPKAFDACVKGGGKVRTKSIGKSKYIKICIPKSGGSSVGGEVHKKKRMV